MADSIKVLLVDDKEDYCQSLAGVARFKGIQIVYKLDWETGFDILKADPFIEFVILDGKGKIEADQETEKDNFVVRAMVDIEDFSRSANRHIPYCVSTAFMERFEALEGNVAIFEKVDAHREKMLSHILAEVAKTEYRTLRMQYDEAFKAFDMRLVKKEYEKLLIKILKAYTKGDYRKTHINTQRDLLEGIFISMNSEIPCIPNDFIDNRDLPNQEWCTRFMENREVNGHRINLPIPRTIKAAFRKLKESTNEYAHLSDKDLVKIPFLSNTFLLMEILAWLPDFAEEQYPDYV